jgi:serine/threonine-protein kinase
LLERCLEKEPRNRYGVIGDARVEIQKVLADPGGVFVQPVIAQQPRKKLRVGLSWVAAALVSGLIIAGVAVWKLKPAEPRQVVRLDYELPKDQQFSGFTMRTLAVSPDGKQFVYGTTKGLYLRSVNELAAKLIAGTEGAALQPFFSPDGKWIGYVSGADRKLKKISINGGAPVALCDLTMFSGASWNEDNTIVFAQLAAGPIMRISANGGNPEAIVKAKSGALAFPQVLPGGEWILYTAAASETQATIRVQSLKSGETKEVTAGVGARYVPTGHIVYAVGNNLLAMPFNLDRLEVTGGPAPVVEDVFRNFAPQYALSDSGTLVYIPGMGAASAAPVGRTLVWVNREGKEEPLGAPPNNYFVPKISPDGTRVAVAVMKDGKFDIWIWDCSRKTLTRLTFDKSNNVPIWTPDSKRIIFASDREGTYGIYWKAADGTGKEEKLFSSPDWSFLPNSLSRDGKILTVAVAKGLITPATAHLDIGILSMEDDRKWKPLLQEKYLTTQPEISPDGRWMAYLSDESGRNEIYVRSFPEVDKGKWQVSTSGGSAPRWSADGRELFYLSSENSVMAIEVKTQPTFSLGVPRILFKSIYSGQTTSSGTPWDISPDGKRLLMLKEPGTGASIEGGPRKINIVLNWFEELKQRVPTK